MSGALIGQFLEDVDYAGAVNPATLQRFAAITAAAGQPGGARWQLAVDLTAKELQSSDEPPAPSVLETAWQERTSALEERTRAFLVAAGYANAESADAKTLETYGPVVTAAGEPDSREWAAAVRLVVGARGKRPPAASKVRSEIERVLREDEERAAERARRVRTAAEEGAESAQAFIREVRAETGEGPTWHQVVRHLGVPNKLGEDVVRQLHELGAVVSTPEPRSLDVPDDAS